DVDKFRDADADRDEKRRELGIPGDAFLLLSVGELNANKNHQAVIRALARLNDSQVHYLLAGIGPKQEELERLAAELGVSRQVHIAGYRDDIPQLYKTADVQVLPSVREGLGLVSIEGMAAGLPLICADNRGTREYAGVFEEHGFQNMCRTIDDYVAAIRRLKSDPDLYFRLCRRGYPAAEKFSLTRVNRKMMAIYEEK
ncbi:MAG: glycosyltransferase family 4 protein, partial [Oscillospiraceae bacterium]|nr:glycosyltransferase family 4 protein [Oscillospiraceae bacterium]